MSFNKFIKLTEDEKIQKLIITYENLAIRFGKDKWIFTCCRNYWLVEEIYKHLLDMMCNVRSFAFYLLDDDEIETKPACAGHTPSVRGLDFLTTDMEIMLDVFYKSLASFEIRGEVKLAITFELSEIINGILKVFEQKYS